LRIQDTMPSSRFGLQAKIIIIISITVVSVVMVSTVIAMVLTRQPIEEEIYRKALAQAKATAQQLVNEHALANPAELEHDLKQMQSDFPSVKQSDVYVHFPSHHLVASTNPAGVHMELDDIPDIERYNEFERFDSSTITIETDDGDYWIMSTALRQNGEVVGCLNLKVSKSRSNVVTQSLVLRNLFLMLSSLTVVFLVIHVFFLRSVRRPMKEMVRVMRGAEGGQLELRAHVSSGDETGQLADHLNRMLDRLKNFNTELAGKVEEATREVADRNIELKRINEELFETQKKLAHSERLAVAGQLAASLAHEIGTPLNSISGHVQLLARQKSGDEVTVRRLQIIESQIDNIVRTVKQLLSWTHRLDLRSAPVDLRHLLEESVLLSSPGLQSRKIAVRPDWPAESIRVNADAGYLQQVFLNLINNSMDAMPNGGELRLRLKQDADHPGERVVMEIEDTGEGIPAENLPHIFEPMFTTKRMGTGTGLGLAVCDQIIREHGGTIQVESQAGRGTLFRIVLPVGTVEMTEVLAGSGGGSGKSTLH
jgi:two-component system, NtrC family, sensor kinase